MCTCILVCKHKKTYLCIVLYSNAYVHILTHTYVHIYIYSCVYVGEHIYLYTFFTCTFTHLYFPSRNHKMIKKYVLRVTFYKSNTVFCKAAMLILEKEGVMQRNSRLLVLAENWDFCLFLDLLYAARPYESCEIFKGRPRRNAFSKLVHRQYKSFPPGRFCQLEIKNTTGLSNKPCTA